MNTVLVTGCNRGIGLEFARQYAAAGWQVHATCRDPGKAEKLMALAESTERMIVHTLDVVDDAAIGRLADSLGETAVDVLINNAGLYPREGGDLTRVDPDSWVEALRVNTIGPLLMTRAFLPHLRRGQEKKVAVITSKVGSIEDNSSGGNYAYRSSKTAVNQVMKNLSIELAPLDVMVVSLHPGWVQTDMGGPNALINTAESVSGLRQVLNNLNKRQTGSFLNYDGAAIPW